MHLYHQECHHHSNLHIFRQILTEATTTESTTTATTEAGAEIYYGDVNQDGVVDLADAIVMNKALANVITLSESAGKIG